jgi:hypothetical protein
MTMEYRFAVVDDQRDVSSSLWRIVMGKDNAYMMPELCPSLDGKYKSSFHRNAGQVGLERDSRKNKLSSCQRGERKLFHRWSREINAPCERLLELWIPTIHLGKRPFRAKPDAIISAPPSGFLVSISVFHVASQWDSIYIETQGIDDWRTMTFLDGAWLLILQRRLREPQNLAQLINDYTTYALNPSPLESYYGSLTSINPNEQATRLLIYKSDARLWIDASLSKGLEMGTSGTE